MVGHNDETSSAPPWSLIPPRPQTGKITANQLHAQKSIGPGSEPGNDKSRRHPAWIDCRLSAQTAVGRGIVVRLSSLLWRLRAVTANLERVVPIQVGQERMARRDAAISSANKNQVNFTALSLLSIHHQNLLGQLGERRGLQCIWLRR